MTKTASDRQREGYSHWDMTVLGWKYNMSNIEAALLVPQFDRLENKLSARERLAKRYVERLSGVAGVTLPAQAAGDGDGVHARHLFPVWVQEGRRDDVVRGLQANGVEVVVNYRAIHLLSYFRQAYGFRKGDFPVAEAIGDATVSLPFFPGMPLEDVDRVAELIEELLSRTSTKWRRDPSLSGERRSGLPSTELLPVHRRD
jgi:UDP-4-amino-4-deoxy-L-arabinose-oxoglutarate aminotransferase